MTDQLDLDSLEALAHRATHGKRDWHVDGDGLISIPGLPESDTSFHIEVHGHSFDDWGDALPEGKMLYEITEANTEFIAALDPATIKRLIALVRAADVMAEGIRQTANLGKPIDHRQNLAAYKSIRGDAA